MLFQQLQHTVSLKRNPPLKWNLSMTGNLHYFEIISNSRYNKFFCLTNYKNKGSKYCLKILSLPPIKKSDYT